jgi:hypothetical protein
LALVFVSNYGYGPAAAFVPGTYTHNAGNGGLWVTPVQPMQQTPVYLEGLWYPIVIAAVSFVVGMVYIKIKIKRSRIKHSYESDKRLLGLVWIALAVATAIIALTF